MSTIVKVCFENDIRRVSLPAEKPYEHLERELKWIYEGRFQEGVQVRYIDDEDDYVTVTSNLELHEALDMSEATLKLFVSPKKPKDSFTDEFVKVSKDGQRTALLKSDSKEDLVENKQIAVADPSKEKAAVEIEPVVEQQPEENPAPPVEEEIPPLKKEDVKEIPAKKEEVQAKKEPIHASFVDDLTIPDDMVVAPGQSLHKVWLVKNTGVRTWPVGTKLVCLEGFGKDITSEIKDPVKKGSDVKVSVALTAPKKKGSHSSLFTLQTPDGEKFGHQYWISIKVHDEKEEARKAAKKAEREAKKAATKKAKEAAIAKKAKEAAAKKAMKAAKEAAKKKAKAEKEAAKKKVEAKKKAEKEAAKKIAEAKKAAAKKMAEAKKAEAKKQEDFFKKLSSKFEDDVTFPDGSPVHFGTKVTKTWLIKNDGKVTWPEGVGLVKAGKVLSPVAECKVPCTKPGESAEISIEMTVPSKPGKFKSPIYSLAYNGKKFGCDFWAIIRAVKPAEKITKTAPKEETKKPILGAHFIKDLTIPDDTLVAPGQIIEKVWLIKNTGDAAWPVGTKLVSLEGSTFGNGATAEIKTLVRKGEQYKLSVKLNVPLSTGKFTSRFTLMTPEGEKFGHKYWANIQVSKFPSQKQLKVLAMDFLADKKVVELLQAELPLIIKEIRNGKKLESILEMLLQKRPQLKSHPFVVFIQPFLRSAERFMGMQIDALVQMYSLWAMTPFAAGATVQAPTMPEDKDGKAGKDDESKKKQKVGKATLPKKSYAKVLAKADKPYKYAKELQQIADMGFKNIEAVRPLLNKHKGNIQNVLAELF